MSTPTKPEAAARYISKSKYLNGRQCSKLLWNAFNAKHLIPAPDAQTQAMFDQGHEVGNLAKKPFPDGIEVGQGVTDFDETIRLTKRALKLRRPLFEAAFAANGGYCRVDILAPAPNGAWDLFEVKSTTAAKDVHLPDLAFQTWVLATAGLQIRRCLLMHINGDFVRNGPVNPKQFFTFVDLTDPVANLAQTVEDRLHDMASVIRRKEEPEINIGPHCDDPYSLEYLRVHYTDVAEGERQRVRRALETYCTQDTIGMAWILDELQRLVAG